MIMIALLFIQLQSRIWSNVLFDNENPECFISSMGKELMEDQHKTKDQLIKELSQAKKEILSLKGKKDLKQLKAEKAIQQEKKSTDKYINSLQGLFYVFDRKRFIKWNREWVKVTGYNDTELSKKNGPDFFEGSDKNLIRWSMEKVFEEGSAVAEAKLVTKRGQKIPYLFSGVRKKLDGKEYLIGMGLDITERKRAEEKLSKTATFLTNIIDASPDMIFVKDLNLRTILCNKVFAQAVNKTSSEMIGNTDIENGWKPEFVYGKPEENIIGFINDDKKALEGYHIHNPNDPANVGDEIRIFDTHKLPLYDPEGNIFCILGIARDITKQKKTEEKRLNLEKRIYLNQKLKSLGLLAGGIAHDFNNLLMAIIGNADLLLMDLTPENSNYIYTEAIKNTAMRAADLTRQMLAYSGEGIFLFQKLNMQTQIEEMKQLIDTYIPPNITFHYQISDNTQSINADLSLIQQIIINLIINASEAIGTKSGKISLEIGTKNCDQEFLNNLLTSNELFEGKYTYIGVSDTGTGMDNETIGKMFDPFFSTKFTGRGLGLAAVQGIVRSHYGAIEISSVPEHGSTIRIFFPVSD